LIDKFIPAARELGLLPPLPAKAIQNRAESRSEPLSSNAQSSGAGEDKAVPMSKSDNDIRERYLTRRRLCLLSWSTDPVTLARRLRIPVTALRIAIKRSKVTPVPDGYFELPPHAREALEIPIEMLTGDLDEPVSFGKIKRTALPLPSDLESWLTTLETECRQPDSVPKSPRPRAVAAIASSPEGFALPGHTPSHKTNPCTPRTPAAVPSLTPSAAAEFKPTTFEQCKLSAEDLLFRWAEVYVRKRLMPRRFQPTSAMQGTM
jgi:hypothetical protein